MSEPIPLTDMVTPPTLPVFNFTWPPAEGAQGSGLALPAIDGRLLMVGGFAAAALVLLMLPSGPTRGRRRR